MTDIKITIEQMDNGYTVGWTLAGDAYGAARMSQGNTVHVEWGEVQRAVAEAVKAMRDFMDGVKEKSFP